jgi:hypothetical protein
MPTAPTTRFTNLKLEPLYNPTQAAQFNVALPPSVSYLHGTVLGEIAAEPGTFTAYASANTDGSQLARVVLVYDVSTDANGNVTFTNTEGQVGDEFGGVERAAPVYFAGTFATQDLVGLDADAAGSLGRLVQGTVTSGVLRMG